MVIQESSSAAHTASAQVSTSMTTPRLVLLGPAWSRAFRCVWMLEELGLPYRIVEEAMPISRAVRKYVSTGKVPVLLEFDDKPTPDFQNPSFVLSESAAINSYLCDRYGGGGLLGEKEQQPPPQLIPPPCTRERALYDQAVSCILSELDAQGLWLHRKHEALAQHFGAIPDAVVAARKQFDRINAHLAQQLHPYLLGSHFTAADILYVHCLDWAKGIGWHGEWPSNVESYRQLCHERPAYQRAKQLRDAGKKSNLGSNSSSNNSSSDVDPNKPRGSSSSSNL